MSSRTFKMLSPGHVHATACSACEAPFDATMHGYETADVGTDPEEHALDRAGTFCGTCMAEYIGTTLLGFRVFLDGGAEAPADVDDVETYWSTERPPVPSAKLAYWLRLHADGWRPDPALGSLGYHEASEFWGVYIWEWFAVLSRIFWPGDRGPVTTIDRVWLTQHGVGVGLA